MSLPNTLKEKAKEAAAFIALALLVVFAAQALDMLKDKFSISEFSPEAFSKRAKLDAEIRDCLLESLHDLGAARVYLYAFHNGTNVGTIPYLKMSMVQEVVAHGMSEEIANEQEVPLALFPREIKKSLISEEGIGIKIEDMEESAMKVALERRGATCLVTHRVLDSQGDIVGLVGADCFGKALGPLTNKELVNKLAHQIEFLYERY